MLKTLQFGVGIHNIKKSIDGTKLSTRPAIIFLSTHMSIVEIQHELVTLCSLQSNYNIA